MSVDADAPGSAVMKVHASTVEQIVKADKEGMGTADLSRATIYAGGRACARAFPVIKTSLDTLARIPFNNRREIAKSVVDSPQISLISEIETKLRNADIRQVADEQTGAGP